MNSKEVIEKLYLDWQEYENKHFDDNESLDTWYTKQEKKYVFLSDAIIGYITYDGDLSLEFGKMVLEVLVQIKNRTTFKYIEDKDNHRKYILICNFIKGWISWGTSIRGAWFEGKIRTHEALSNVGHDKDYIEITEEFINWFVDWLQTE